MPRNNKELNEKKLCLWCGVRERDTLKAVRGTIRLMTKCSRCTLIAKETSRKYRGTKKKEWYKKHPNYNKKWLAKHPNYNKEGSLLYHKSFRGEIRKSHSHKHVWYRAKKRTVNLLDLRDMSLLVKYRCGCGDSYLAKEGL